MPEFLNEISQQELGQRMLNNELPFRGFVKFENNLSIPLEIDPLGTHEIESPGIGTFGMISVSDSIPKWVDIPDAVNYQEAYTVGWYGYASNTITGAGALSGIIERSGTNKTVRFSKNGQFSPKLYDGWKGGSRARIKTYKVTSLAKKAGSKFFVIGVILDGIGAATDEISWARFATNTTVSTIMLLGGWPGLAIGLVYWGLDLMGVFDHHITGNSYQPKLLTHPVDNLRVVIPVGP